jgi:hypothetical protein
LSINPADSKNCENYIKFPSQGKIFSDDETMNYELYTILNLNIQSIQENPKVALDAIIEVLNQNLPNRPWSKEALKKKLEELTSKDEEGKYSPYCQYIVWYLSKILNNP